MIRAKKIREKKQYVIALLAVGLTASVCVACRNEASVAKAQNQEIVVEAVTLRATTSLREREYIGTVEESSSVSLSFNVPGQVLQVYVREGQLVKKGQLLAEVDTLTVHQMYTTSKATLDQAEDAYERMSKLYEAGTLPDIQFVDIKTKLEQARAAERISAKSLQDTKLYAPSDGVIGKRMAEVGLNLLPGQPVFELMNTQALVIKAAIPENEIYHTRIGQSARATVNALNGAEIQGKVAEKGVAAHPFTHTYEVKINLASSNSHLMPGMVCRVYIANLPNKEALIVPNRAVLPMDFGKGYFVWVVDQENLVHRREVTIGDLVSNGIVITQGLKAGDRVIVSGYHKVSENVKVSVANE